MSISLALKILVASSSASLAVGCGQQAQSNDAIVANIDEPDGGKSLGYSCDNYEDLNASTRAELANATDAGGKGC